MKKFITIQADKARNLRYTFNSLMTLEENLDRPITEIGNNISFKDINVLVWAGLLHEDKDLTREQAGDIIDEVIENEGLQSLIDKVSQALTNTFGNTVQAKIKK